MGISTRFLLPLVAVCLDERWSADECYMCSETPVYHVDLEPDVWEESAEDIMYQPLADNVFQLKGTHEKDPSTLETTSCDYGLEYDLNLSEYLTTCASPPNVLKKSTSNAKHRSVTATRPFKSGSPNLIHQEIFFIETIDAVLEKSGGFLLIPTDLSSGQGYKIQGTSASVGLAVFAPISQERGMYLDPQGRKNASPEAYPTSEFYLREAVAYALDKRSNGVFHIPMTITARITGLGEGVLKEHIEPCDGRGDVNALALDELHQFRLLFDIFFFNGNCQPDVFGRGFYSAHSNPDNFALNVKPKVYFMNNAFILPSIDTPTQELISSFSKHYQKGDRCSKKWSSHVEDFANNIDDPRSYYSDILVEHGFPIGTCDNVAMVIQIAKKSIAHGLSPWELLDFLYFNEHAFIFTSFSIANRSLDTGRMDTNTWNNFTAVIDLAIVSYSHRNQLQRKSGKNLLSLHMVNLASQNYRDLQEIKDKDGNP